MSEEPQDIPEVDGPDPRTWPGDPDIARCALDVRAVDDHLKLLTGEIAQDGMSPQFEEARSLLRVLGRASRENLAAALLAAYKISLPDEDPPVP